MHQVKVSLESPHLEFVNRHRAFGFKDRSSMVRSALQQMQEKLEQQRLQASAELYAEAYESDIELQDLTTAALNGWPE